MSKISLITALTLAAGMASAEGQQAFKCISEKDGREFVAEHPADSDKGTVKFADSEGEATVVHGLDGITFIHIAENDVWTLALHLEKMTYELSVHGAQNFEDHGTCEQV